MTLGFVLIIRRRRCEEDAMQVRVWSRKLSLAGVAAHEGARLVGCDLLLWCARCARKVITNRSDAIRSAYLAALCTSHHAHLSYAEDSHGDSTQNTFCSAELTPYALENVVGACCGESVGTTTVVIVRRSSFVLFRCCIRSVG